MLLDAAGRRLLTVKQVLVNFALLLALGAAQITQYIFFGSLRPMEVEVRKGISMTATQSN